jgi:hypothetical protein
VFFIVAKRNTTLRINNYLLFIMIKITNVFVYVGRKKVVAVGNVITIKIICYFYIQSYFVYG